MAYKKAIWLIVLIFLISLNFTRSETTGDTIIGDIQVSGTEYQAGDTAKTFVQFQQNGIVVNNGVCNVDIYYPNLTKFVNNATMIPLGENGLYTYNITIPNVTGIFPISARCNYLFNQTVNNYYTTQKEDFNTQSSCGSVGFLDNWQSQGDTIYSSLVNENQTDGTADNFISFAGTTGATLQQNQTSFMITKATTGTANLMHIKINSQSGTPSDKSFLYEMSFCNTTKSSLTSNMSKYADCSGNPKILSKVSNLSCLIGDTIQGDERPIYFTDSPFSTYTGQNAMINFILINYSSNAIGQNNFWTAPVDTFATSNYFRRNTNASSSVFPMIPDFELLNTGAIISNDTSCFSPPYCLQITKNSISRKIDDSNVIGLNISFYAKLIYMENGEIANVNFYDGTWHTIKSYEAGDEIPQYALQNVVLSGYNFNDGNKLQFEIVNPVSNQTALWIDNITIQDLVVNVSAINKSYIVQAQGSSELHVTTNLVEIKGIVQSILDFISNNVFGKLLEIMGVVTTNQAKLNQSILMLNGTQIQLSNITIILQNITINLQNVSTKSDIIALNFTIINQSAIIQHNMSNYFENMVFGEALS